MDRRNNLTAHHGQKGEGMTKQQAKDIATALIALSGIEFDPYAFEDSTDLINKSDEQIILKEIDIACTKMINKIEKKYGIELSEEQTKIVIKKILNN